MYLYHHTSIEGLTGKVLSCLQLRISVLVTAASLASFSTLVVPNCILGASAGSEHTASDISRHFLNIMALWCTIGVIVVPHFTELGPAIIFGACSCCSLVVPWSSATYIWHKAVFLCQGFLNIRKRISGGVGRSDSRLSQPLVRRQLAEISYNCLKELKKIGVFGCLRSLENVMISDTLQWEDWGGGSLPSTPSGKLKSR